MKKAVVISNLVRNLLKMHNLIVLSGLLLINWGTSAQESIYDIIRNDDCPANEVYGEPELFVGDNLFDLINGGAELYHEYGFMEVLAAKMSIPGADPVKVEIYDMGSPESAWGIYSMTATSNSKSFIAGTSGRLGEGFSQFVKGSYMVYLYYDQVEETELKYIADCISHNIKKDAPEPQLLKAVDALEEKADKLIYFKGNLGLSSIYSFHYKDVFGYNEGAAAVYPDIKIFLLNYGDEGLCTEHYNEARDFFMESSKYHDQFSLRVSFHMKDRKEQQIDCYFENTFLIIFLSSGEEDLNDKREEIVSKMNEF
jgi:hypothetical protein